MWLSEEQDTTGSMEMEELEQEEEKGPQDKAHESENRSYGKKEEKNSLDLNFLRMFVMAQNGVNSNEQKPLKKLRIQL
jgi:hypothetical protein